MPKPRWGWFAVAIVAMITGIWLVSAGFVATPSGGNAGPGLLVGLLGLLTVWSFGKAFFNFTPPEKR